VHVELWNVKLVAVGSVTPNCDVTVPSGVGVADVGKSVLSPIEILLIPGRACATVTETELPASTDDGLTLMIVGFGVR